MIKNENLLDQIQKDYLNNSKIEVRLALEMPNEDYLEYKISLKVANHNLDILIVEDGYDSTIEIYEGFEIIVFLADRITDLDSCLDNLEEYVGNWLMLDK